MAKRRITKYSRRRGRAEHRSKAPAIVLTVILFVVLCLVISVAIGILLGQKAEILPDKQKYDFEKVEYTSGNKTVRSVEAYHFPRGASADDYASQEIEFFSFELRGEDGTLNYGSAVGEEMAIDKVQSDISLKSTVDAIHGAGGYACAYFHVTSFDTSDKYLREVYKAYEIALIAEAARCGVDDILIVGIDVTPNNIDEVEDFLARAAMAADTAALGTLISEETLYLTEQEIYVASRIKTSCDYIALDLSRVQYQSGSAGIDKDEKPSKSALEVALDRAEYYIRSYSMRVVFARGNSELYKEALALGVVDFQVVDK